LSEAAIRHARINEHVIPLHTAQRMLVMFAEIMLADKQMKVQDYETRAAE
jgi:hypothetical protein